MERNLVLLISLMLSLSGCGGKVEGQLSNAEVARINGETISREEFERFFAIPDDVEPEARRVIEARYSNPENKRAFLERLITRKLLLQHAKQIGIDQRPSFQKSVEEILLRELEQEIYSDTEVPDKALRQHYEAHPEQYMTPVMVRLQQIRVSKKQTAEMVRERLSRGEDFAWLAKAFSTDLFASSGGDIGYYPVHSLVPEVRGVVSQMKMGKWSGVIQRPDDYVIVKLLDRQGAKPIAFEEVKEKIREQLLKKAYEDYLATLKAEAKIAVNEELLK
ncbi:MAG: peptidyl-prolyl cis-trans isomerase [Acidobacteria bacterium]|nr:peptidyl-prolyl cis-trans isomerase [Acidobacteriota bacterium]